MIKIYTKGEIDRIISRNIRKAIKSELSKVYEMLELDRKKIFCLEEAIKINTSKLWKRNFANSKK